MAWLKLTTADGQAVLINSGQIARSASGAEIWSQGSLLSVRETIDEITAMIEQAEWRERVLRVACAIWANEHAMRGDSWAGLTFEQVWERAARFAAIDPERPKGG